jgi:hypothetical protein
MDIVLRAYGEQFDVGLFLNQYQGLIVSDAFNKGEPDMLGNANEYSGFDVTVAENDMAYNCLKKMQQFLDVHQPALVFLKAHEISCVLDLDVTVGAGDEMPASFNLSPRLLGALHQLNIAIEFSAYPPIEGL